MYLKIIDNKEAPLSESGLIKTLLGQPYQAPRKPEPDKALALQAMDFWIEEWHMQGVEVLSAELHTEFDPEEDYWYFVIELFIDLDESVEASVDKEFKIIDKMAAMDPLPEWFNVYTVITNRRENGK